MPDKEALRKVLFDIIKDCHCNDKCDPYCTLIEIILSLGKPARFLVLVKCVEKLQYEINTKERNSITWNDAFQLWIDKGYAKKYSEIYHDGMTVDDVFSLVKEG